MNAKTSDRFRLHLFFMPSTVYRKRPNLCYFISLWKKLKNGSYFWTISIRIAFTYRWNSMSLLLQTTMHFGVPHTGQIATKNNSTLLECRISTAVYLSSFRLPVKCYNDQKLFCYTLSKDFHTYLIFELGQKLSGEPWQYLDRGNRL